MLDFENKGLDVIIIFIGCQNYRLSIIERLKLHFSLKKILGLIALLVAKHGAIFVGKFFSIFFLSTLSLLIVI